MAGVDDNDVVDIDVDVDESHRQPIYMEVEDSGYTEDSSSTPSSGSNTHNLANSIKDVESKQTSVTILNDNGRVWTCLNRFKPVFLANDIY